MPRAVVVLPTTTYRAKDFLSAAEALDVDLVVASEEPSPLPMDGRHIQIDCSDLETAASQIAALGDEVALDGVVAADDAGVEIAALTGTRLGLRANTPLAAAATRNKGLMREMLARAEVPQPRWDVIESNEVPEGLADGVGYPLVMKPMSKSASQGVIRVDTEPELQSTADRIRSIVGEDAPILIEQFMPGAEIAIEGLVTDGELTVLAVFDKPETGEGPYFPETMLITPSRLAAHVQDECRRVAANAIKALGITFGPVHVELKADGDRVGVIEVAARSIGGLCSRSLNFGLMGTTLETLILRNAIGMDKPELRREQHSSGILMVPIPASGEIESIEGADAVRAVHGITGLEFTMRPGDEVRAAPDGESYLGFVFAKSTKPEEVEKALAEANRLLNISIRQ